MLCSKQETKTILISRFGMLECGKNYKGTSGNVCRECQIIDDENHRMNHCTKFREMNHCDSETKVNFNLIYSNNFEVLRGIIPEITEVWNLRNATGTMNC